MNKYTISFKIKCCFSTDVKTNAVIKLLHIYIVLSDQKASFKKSNYYYGLL